MRRICRRDGRMKEQRIREKRGRDGRTFEKGRKEAEEEK